MVNLTATISCLDIGNTISHMGYYLDGKLIIEENIPTSDLIKESFKFSEFSSLRHKELSYCSVVPEAENSLIEYSNINNIKLYNLNFKSNHQFPINYPKPDEIGQDRIANSLAVYHSVKLPCVVVDIGTATTFDVISQSGGYEGGLITPGPQGFLDFLAENTALLPKVNIYDQEPKSIIGKDTKDAMLMGAIIGYSSMVQGINKTLIDEVRDKFGQEPTIIKTGGACQNFELENSIHQQDLTIYGLALAFQLNSTR
jgi:type III pantothenate kinase